MTPLRRNKYANRSFPDMRKKLVISRLKNYLVHMREI